VTSIFENLGALTIGLAIGYVAASLLESYMHQRVGHAPCRSVRRWERHPRLFRSPIDTRYSHHVVHHRRSFRQDHVTQFRSDEERARVDLELGCRGAQSGRIRRSGYGLRLQGDGALAYLVPVLPTLPLLWFPWGAAAAIGVCTALALPPLLSHFIHRYLHMPHERALKDAPALTAWLLGRGYFRAMARSHYLHHRYMAFNFNLLLGGDVLRGCHRAPAAADLLEMQRLGLRID
jgi:hypothetical protein